jgi:hypothetical protein
MHFLRKWVCLKLPRTPNSHSFLSPNLNAASKRGARSSQSATLSHPFSSTIDLIVQ